MVPVMVPSRALSTGPCRPSRSLLVLPMLLPMPVVLLRQRGRRMSHALDVRRHIPQVQA